MEISPSSGEEDFPLRETTICPDFPSVHTFCTGTKLFPVCSTTEAGGRSIPSASCSTSSTVSTGMNAMTSISKNRSDRLVEQDMVPPHRDQVADTSPDRDRGGDQRPSKRILLSTKASGRGDHSGAGAGHGMMVQ